MPNFGDPGERLKFKIIVAFLGLSILIIIGNILLFPSRAIIQLISPYICPQATYFVRTDKPLVALTIDDSPSSNTLEILATLSKYRVKATFFIISSLAENYPEIVSQIVKQGHEIGNHLTKDEPSIKLGDRFETEFLKADRILSQFASLKWFRPGSGFCNQVMSEIVKKHNYEIALGTIWSYDTHILSSRSYVIFALEQLSFCMMVEIIIFEENVLSLL